MDIISLGLFSYYLHRMADRLNISPWRWVIRYVLTYLFILFVILMMLISYIGQEVFVKEVMNPENQKYTYFAIPVSLLIQFLLYLLFKKNIQLYSDFLDKKEQIIEDFKKEAEKKDNHDDTDFSYFR